MASRLIYACGVVIAVAMIAVARIDPRVSPLAFFACVGSAGVSYLTVVWLLPCARLESRTALLFCLGLAALWRVPLLVSPPLLSTDIYRYVWDGRLQHLGYDPYTVIPDDPAVAKLHDRDTKQMNHPWLPTPYPPVAQFFFRVATRPSASVRAMKAALVLCDALIVIVLLRWLDASGRGAVRVLAYAWNPLVALEVAGNGHVDVLGALLLVLAACCLTERRRALAATAWMLAIGVKVLPIVLAPLFWRRVRPRDVALGAVLLIVFYVPFVSRHGLPIGSLGTYVDYWRFNAPLFGLAEMVLPSRLVTVLAALAGVAVAARLRQTCAVDAPAAWAWPLAAVLLAVAAVYPWYLLWLTPFLTAGATWPLAVWTVSVLVTYLDLIFGLPWWAVALEYGLVLAAAAPLMRSVERCPIEA
jgi:hypothetical protein